MEISVGGSASREVMPDRAAWSLAIQEIDPDAKAAFARCAERLTAIAERLSTVGEVSTGRVSVDALQRRRGESGPRQVARASLTVEGPLERAGELAAAAMDAGADEIHGPSFSSTADAAELQEALLAEAVLNARRRAEAMANAAGRRLGGAVKISDGTPDYGYGEEYATAVAAVGGAPEPAVRARPRTLRAAVHVVFELRD